MSETFEWYYIYFFLFYMYTYTYIKIEREREWFSSLSFESMYSPLKTFDSSLIEV